MPSPDDPFRADKSKVLSKIVQIISPQPDEMDFVPSRFTARAIGDDGALIVYNSYSGAFSAFPARVRERVEAHLRQRGLRGKAEGLTKYLYERGFIVQRNTNELERMRLRFGQSQYRTDRLELILLGSEECNFRCVYCYEMFPRGTMEPWVRSAVISFVERKAPSINSVGISWFGGEPLLGYEAMQEVCPGLQSIAAKNDLHLASDITTNGYLLTPDVFRSLLDWDVRSFQITLDGPPDAHDCKRPLKGGGKTFDRIFQNMMAMKDFPDEFMVHLRINFDQQNLPDMPDYIAHLKERFGADQRFRLRFYPVGKWGGPNDENLEICGRTGYEQRQQLELLAIKNEINTETRLDYMQPAKNLGVCYAARPFNFIVGADGKLMKCTIALDTKDYNIVGHLTTDGRAELDLDKFLRWVAPSFEDDVACKKCFYVPVCQGCSCPLERIENDTRPCPPEKTKIGPTLKALWVSQRAGAAQYSIPSPSVMVGDVKSLGSPKGAGG